MNALLRLLLIGFLQIPILEAQSTMNVPKISPIQKVSFISISEALENAASLQTIGVQNWEAFDYIPKVNFRIAHDTNTLYLKFYVTENHILAQHTQTNASTHRDSCVEFFIDPDQSGGYYNFEFNCIGTIHLAYGPDRNARQFVDPNLIKEAIFIESTLGNAPFAEQSGTFEWEMAVAINAKAFALTPELVFNSLIAKANFYKCGDDTQIPHYISWSNIGTERPDFHRPEYFGTLLFD
ncbi:MAG: hypothetical protein RLZZ241_568 [Bacteroidota bacterium]|jgi:hypothetical protein